MLNKKLQKSLDEIDILLKSYSKQELQKELNKYEENIGISIQDYCNQFNDSIIYKLENYSYDLKILNNNKIMKCNLLKIYQMLNQILYSKNFNTYNEILNKINIEKLDVTIIIALLRLSFLFKEKIIEWNIFLKKSIVELNKRNFDSQKLLIGLI